MSSKTTLQNQNPHKEHKPHDRAEGSPEATLDHETAHGTNFTKHGTEQHQPLDAGPRSEGDATLGKTPAMDAHP